MIQFKPCENFLAPSLVGHGWLFVLDFHFFLNRIRS